VLHRDDQLPVLNELATALNVPLMLWLIVMMIAMQPTRANVNITTDSIALGPSSLASSREIDGKMRDMILHPQALDGIREVTNLDLSTQATSYPPWW
jgi:hypothetical protein